MHLFVAVLPFLALGCFIVALNGFSRSNGLTAGIGVCTVLVTVVALKVVR